MGIDRLKHIKDSLMCCVEGQMHHLDSVDTKELGEAIDMIKDLEEAIYYCTITEAMKEKEKEPKYYPMMQNGGQRSEYEYGYPDENRMYLDGGQGGGGRSGQSNGGSRGGSSGGGSQGGSNRGSSNGGAMSQGGRSRNSEGEFTDSSMRDEREGRSGEVRKLYMEGKQYEHSKEDQMKELEKYVHELTEDIVEMIEDATTEEKQFLSKKIATLATKIGAAK